jgi:aminomethyltransferase
MAADELRLTPLHNRHIAAGARFGPFAGWRMPIRYTDVRDEHLAVRERAGVFDISHMGQIEITGPGARDLLHRALTNDIERLQPGQAQYTLICQDDGGVIDDLIAYCLADRTVLVVNASNVAACDARLRGLAGDDVVIDNRSDAQAMLAVQGPMWREAIGSFVGSPAPVTLDVFGVVDDHIAGVPCMIARTGYTGEPGVEIVCANERVGEVWDALASGPHPPTPIGLGARDTLRLEMGYPLYGHELSTGLTPIEAGLAWACDIKGGHYAGAEKMQAQVRDGVARRLVAFAMTENAIPRADCRVLADGRPVGHVTSGSLSPSLGIGIGMAYVASEHAAIGTQIQIEVRGAAKAAEIRKKPLVDTSPRKGD